MQTGGEADLDGPKSSRPLALGESGRPLANPSHQRQTDGRPAKILNSSVKNRPATETGFSFSTIKETQTFKIGDPPSPCSSVAPGIGPPCETAVQGSAFSIGNSNNSKTRKPNSNNKLTKSKKSSRAGLQPQGSGRRKVQRKQFQHCRTSSRRDPRRSL